MLTTGLTSKIFTSRTLVKWTYKDTTIIINLTTMYTPFCRNTIASVVLKLKTCKTISVVRIQLRRAIQIRCCRFAKPTYSVLCIQLTAIQIHCCCCISSLERYRYNNLSILMISSSERFRYHFFDITRHPLLQPAQSVTVTRD